MITLPASLEIINNALLQKGYRPVVVGGYLRDTLLNLPSKDIDIEVFGCTTLTELEEVLSTFGKVHRVGKSFGVIKLQLADLEVDFSLPRQEEKVGKGHKGFAVTLDGTLTFREAAIRRDFTMNAMGYDLQTRTLLDPFRGQDDLNNRRLDIVNTETFVEDPLRLYRAVQFAARFELEVSKELHEVAREMVNNKMLDELPKERVFEEIRKLLLKSRKPSIGFKLMDAFGMLAYFPELKALQGVPQDPDYHPEGDVWIHTLMVVDAVTTLHTDDEKKNLTLSLAALCHDLGKANTTELIDGRISAIGHENTGVALTETFLGRLSEEKGLIEKVVPLVQHHLKPLQFYKQGAKAAAIRRLASRVNIEELIVLAKADFLGRTTTEALEGDFKAGAWLAEEADKLHVRNRPLEPLVLGRDLIRAGFVPSKQFSEMLTAVYEKQMDGEIGTKEEGLNWLLGNYGPSH